ncbi:GFA family protein [Vibrio sp. S4M6]|nr:GFA family protein [Vibrio sinus]
MNGSAFSTYAVIHQPNFELLTGVLHSFAVSEFARKHFCRQCGTPIFNSNPTKYPDFTILHYGCLDNHQDFKPSVNIYTRSKLDWVNVLDSLPSYCTSIQ